jgi:hypothetical protein
MAAGLGFKTFTTGEVLTAADVNGYLMQGVLVFASEAARNSAITSPQEGQFAYTKDNNSLWYYTGSAWAASGATGDIEGVTAGTGISGGGTSGTVTITNSMATEITAKADLIVGTGNAAFDNLAVGANGTVLTADSTVSPTGLKWAAPASGGGMTLLNSGSTTLSGTTTTFNITTTGYKHLFVVLKDIYTAAEGTSFNLRINGDSDGDYYHAFNYQFGTTTAGDAADGATSFPIQFRTSSTNGSYFFVSGAFWLMQVQDSTTHICNWQVHGHSNSGTGQTVTNGSGFYRASAVVSSISFVSGQSVSGGEAFIYGVA